MVWPMPTWRCKYARWPTFQVDGAHDHVPSRDVLPVQVEEEGGGGPGCAMNLWEDDPRGGWHDAGRLPKSGNETNPVQVEGGGPGWWIFGRYIRYTIPTNIDPASWGLEDKSGLRPTGQSKCNFPRARVAYRISSMSSDHHHIPIISPLDSDEIHTVWNPYEIHMSMAGVAAVSWLQTALWSYGISLMESWRCIWLGGISRSIFQRHSNA